MNSLEFTTKIEHGVIRLPKEFEDYEDAVAHVAVTLETPEDLKAKKIDCLRHSKKLKKRDFSPRSKTLFNGREN